MSLVRSLVVVSRRGAAKMFATPRCINRSSATGRHRSAATDDPCVRAASLPLGVAAVLCGVHIVL